DSIKAAVAAGFWKHGEPPQLIALKTGLRLHWSGLPRLLFGASHLPNVPPAVDAEMQAFGPIGMPALEAEMEGGYRSMEEAGRLRTLGDRPVVVLTARRPSAAQNGMNPAQYVVWQKIDKQEQDDLASWSTHSRHEHVPDSTHYIQFDRPDVVTRVVKEVV